MHQAADAGWYAAAERYQDFLRRHKGAPVLFLELGVVEIWIVREQQ